MIYLVCLPVAVFLGYLLATPDSMTDLMPVVMVVGVLSFPLLVRWHHLLLVASWNTFFITFFLPGQPGLWIVMACLSLSLALLERTLMKRTKFLHVSSISMPLILLTCVVLGTAYLTGGIGGRAFGSEVWGGKRYLGLLGAVIGYFALVARPIPRERALLYVSLYILSGMTAVLGDLAYAAGSRFEALFALFNWEVAYLQASTQGSLRRFASLTFAAQAVYWFLFLRYGIRGLFDLARPHRLVLMGVAFVVGLLGGYRSGTILFVLFCVVQFLSEGLLRSRFLPAFLLVGVLGGAVLIGFTDRMPLSIQRSLSFLPVHVDPVAKLDADGTLNWRLEMWRVVWKEVPDHLFFGKGYGFIGSDLYLTQEAMRRGFFTSFEDTVVSGNYHNGWLTMVIPFGIWAVICFLWFCWSALKILRRNQRYGDPELKAINTFLLSYFVTRLIFYMVFYGQFDLDLMVLTGTVGLSVALNGGVRGPESVREVVIEDEPGLNGAVPSGAPQPA